MSIFNPPFKYFTSTGYMNPVKILESLKIGNPDDQQVGNAQRDS